MSNVTLEQPRSQGLSSLPPLAAGTETLVAAGHVTIYPSKTARGVGTQVHLVERTRKYPTLPADFSTTQILDGHATRVSVPTTKGTKRLTLELLIIAMIAPPLCFTGQFKFYFCISFIHSALILLLESNHV